MLLRNEHSRLRSSPLPVPRTVRRHDLRVLTSLPAGKMVPLAVVPLLREDAITRGTARLSFEMMETVELLMNAINVSVKAYLVPNLAFERFISNDDLNRAYEGVPRAEGEDVIPYIDTMAAPAHGANDVLTYLGKHWASGATISSAYVEAYNAIWNFRARNRSLNITLRDRLDGDLAPAFWLHNQFNYVVPDFDQALMDGEVGLTVIPGGAPVKAPVATDAPGAADVSVQYPTTSESTYFKVGTAGTYALQAGVAGLEANKLYANLTAVFDELTANGIRISLSNLEMARKTQAFAQLRRAYHGHTDEWLIDLLMDGITIPDQAWKHPILLAEEQTVFGMAKRYASDSGNLTESVVNGATFVDLRWTCPKVHTGGVVMIVAEITPEQLFERQRDVYMHSVQVFQLPQYLRDSLDPEKVGTVTNGFVDTSHSDPNAVFGYIPLNFEWTQNPPQIGGRFYRPAVNTAFDEARQRIWAVETVDPVLSEDFYLATAMHQKPFVVTNQDPFEVVVRGEALITGNTVFGPAIIEAEGDYAEVLEEAPIERIEQE